MLSEPITEKVRGPTLESPVYTTRSPASSVVRDPRKISTKEVLSTGHPLSNSILAAFLPGIDPAAVPMGNSRGRVSLYRCLRSLSARL